MKVDILLGLQWGDEGKGKVEEIQTKQEEASKKGFFGRLFGK